jgi:hypothetical protein
LERVRDDLYAFARITVDGMAKGQTSKASFTAVEVIRSIPEAARADVIERAAIIEFDAGHTRDAAERLAIAGLLGRSNASGPNRSGEQQGRTMAS